MTSDDARTGTEPCDRITQALAALRAQHGRLPQYDVIEHEAARIECGRRTLEAVVDAVRGVVRTAS